MIVLEPEAAAVYCKLSNVITADWDEEQDASVAYARGTRYLLADMGGGTVDVTVHSVGNDDKIRELYHATGGAWGGSYVDLEFSCLLERIFSKALMNDFQSKSPSDWIVFLSKFENAKRTVTLGERLRVEMPWQFIEFVRTQGKTVEGLIKDFQNKNVTFFRGSLVLAYPEAKRLFEKVFNNITSHLKSILELVADIKYVILVGGFSSLRILQQRIKEKLPSSVRVITVRECWLAVVMGAVLFGHDSSLIASRRMKYTYGVACRGLFDEELDPAAYRVVDDKGVVRCRNRFATFVEKNEEVKVGDEVTHVFSPEPEDAAKVPVLVYSSETVRPRHTTDEGVRKAPVAKMELAMPKTKKGADRKILVAMRFGKTEIEVVSRDCSSGEEVQKMVDLDFLG